MDDPKERTMTKQQVQKRPAGNISDNDDGIPKNGAIFDNTPTGEALDGFCGVRDGISRDKPPKYVDYRRYGPGVIHRRY
jgi:hypothetical protein